MTTRDLDLLDPTGGASCFPSQPLLAEVLRRPVEFTTYASEDYQKVLAEHGITCSMSRRGNVYDNAAMERRNSTLKSELGERFEDNETAEKEVVGYIEGFYNPHRRHSALSYMSPAEYERSARVRLVA